MRRCRSNCRLQAPHSLERRRVPAASNLPLTNERCGFSLIEIIIATAILMGSVIVLAQLAGMGRSMAQKADLQAKAQRVCERTLNEIVLGERPMQTVQRTVLEPVTQVSGQPIENVDNSSIRIQPTGDRWLHSVFVTPLAETPHLVRVTVTVELAPATENTDKVIKDPSANNAGRFTLSRWVRSSSGESETPFAGAL